MEFVLLLLLILVVAAVVTARGWRGRWRRTGRHT